MPGKFAFPKTRTSLPFWSNNVNITKAKLTWTGSANQIKWELGVCETYEGTYVWEEVQNATEYTFTGLTTGKWIKWRGTGVEAIVTKIEVEINGG